MFIFGKKTKPTSLDARLNKEYALNRQIAELEVLAQELKGAYGEVAPARSKAIGIQMMDVLITINNIRFDIK